MLRNSLNIQTPTNWGPFCIFEVRIKMAACPKPESHIMDSGLGLDGGRRAGGRCSCRCITSPGERGGRPPRADLLPSSMPRSCARESDCAPQCRSGRRAAASLGASASPASATHIHTRSFSPHYLQDAGSSSLHSSVINVHYTVLRCRCLLPRC